MRRALFLVTMVCLGVFTVKAQDSAKVDPQHCKVEFENAQVRVAGHWCRSILTGAWITAAHHPRLALRRVNLDDLP